MSENDEVAQPMVVSKREVDDQMKSVMKDFEVTKLLCLHLFLQTAQKWFSVACFVQGDADKNSWVNFQQRVDKAPEQVVR